MIKDIFSYVTLQIFVIRGTDPASTKNHSVISKEYVCMFITSLFTILILRVLIPGICTYHHFLFTEKDEAQYVTLIVSCVVASLILILALDILLYFIWKSRKIHYANSQNAYKEILKTTKVHVFL